MDFGRLLLVAALVGCGPSVEIPGGDEPAGEDTDGDDGPAPSTTVSTTPPPSTSSTTMDGDESSSSSGDSSDSTDFIEDTDVGETIECNLFDQDCPAGEKCMPYANDGGSTWNATKCTPIADDPGQVDEPCTVEESGVSGVDDCDAGLMCWDVDPDTLEGECIAFCIGDESEPVCADEDDWCSITGDGILTLCFHTCDPLGSDCDADEVCIPVHTGDFVCANNATPPGEGNAGDPCEYVNVCNQGLVCVGSDYVPGCEDSVGCCTPFCDVTAPDCPDPAQEECLPWFDNGAAPPGYENVGICGIPQD